MWEFGICPNCKYFKRISRMEKVKMKVGSKDIEVWVCPVCGFMRTL